MKNRGFTLIELLAVIIIIGALATITTPIIINSIKASRDAAYERQKDMIIDAAKRWTADNVINTEDIPIDPSNDEISINYLQKEGYLDSNKIKNPKGGEMDGCVKITRDEKNTNKYKYEYEDNCSNTN